MRDDTVDFKTLLARVGFRVTPKRLRILDILKKAERPLSIEEVARLMRPHTVDQATLYRSLQAFHTKGIVRQVIFAPGRALYELADDEHHHIVCTKCGYVEDFHFDDCKKLETKVLKDSKKFATIAAHSLEMYGLCTLCSGK